MVLQVHPSQGRECGGIGALAPWPLPIARAGRCPLDSRCRLAGQLGGAAQPAAQGLSEREMAEAVGAFALFSSRSSKTA